MKKDACRLIVFVKAPIPGGVKTRLIPVLGPERTVVLYRHLILRCLQTALKARVGPVDLWCSPSKEHPFFKECAETFKINLHEQTEGDLGSRMEHAFDETFSRSHRALLIGTDSPTQTSTDLEEARRLLENGSDAVIGPAEDGGYVLLGLCRSDHSLFRDIPWGTESVLIKTRERLQRLGWRWQELPKRWDVDRPEDVDRLVREGLLRGWER